MREKIETTYICEICGAEFSEKDMCERHERYEKLLRECRFWDSDCNRLSITDLDCQSDEVWYIDIPSKQHADAVNYWLDNEGAQTVKYTQCGMYFYEISEDWVHISALYKMLNQLKEMEREED